MSTVDAQTACRSTVVTDRGGRAALIALRLELASRVFSTGAAPLVSVGGSPAYLAPSEAYMTAFLAELDQRVQMLLVRTFDDERAAIWRGRRLPPRADTGTYTVERGHFDAPGVIYVFRNTQLARLSIVKIGRTTRTARDRLVEWERLLAPEDDKQLQLLFAIPTQFNEFAETVVHNTLMCERLDKYINEFTGDPLKEFFDVPQFMALKLFIILCVAYCDEFGRAERSQFKGSPQGFVAHEALL